MGWIAVAPALVTGLSGRISDNAFKLENRGAFGAPQPAPGRSRPQQAGW